MNSLVYPSISRIMDVSAFKDEATAKAALATLRWLDNGAPHKLEDVEIPLVFDMEYFIRFKDSRNDDGFACGTTCCMAGAISLHKTHGSIEGRYVAGRSALENEFNIDADDKEDELVKLFFPADADGDCIPTTAQQAAEALRGYLFTGKTVWNYDDVE